MATTEKDLMSLSFEEYCREVFDPEKVFEKPEPLKGYRVIDCTQYILGPSCGSYLAELGAEVIKFEMPRRGEPMRHTTPWNERSLYPLSRWMPDRGTGFGFVGANFNKYHVTLDFHKEEAKEIFRRFATKADIMIENYRPGTFDRWGIGPRQMMSHNPNLIYCWMGGFGGWGPGRVRASYDILGQAQGGAFGITGHPEFLGGTPSKHTIWLADYWGGMMGVMNILAALYRRETEGGGGTFIEISQVHGVARMLEYSLPLYKAFGVVRQRWGNWDTQLCVHGIVQCGLSSYPDSENPQENEEGYILISAHTDEDWEKLCAVMNRPDLRDKYPTHADRVKAESQIEIYTEIEKWTKDKTKEDVQAILDEAGIVNQPVWNSKEVAEHPHYHMRGTIRWMQDPVFGEMLVQGPPLLMSETPPRVKWLLKPVGMDNESVYQNLLGYSPDQIAQWEEEGVI
ncbi:MAG TPA: CoA transferase [Sphingobacteriaceae bacterium]|nr:CoA transferase [Sphingobacteriaceae bacterium]